MLMKKIFVKNIRASTHDFHGKMLKVKPTIKIISRSNKLYYVIGLTPILTKWIFSEYLYGTFIVGSNNNIKQILELTHGQCLMAYGHGRWL
jgi:hypothetical protein